MEMFLMDETYDAQVASSSINLNKLPLDNVVKKPFILKKKGQIDLEFILKYEDKHDLRYSARLCDREKRFRTRRIEHVFKSLQSLLGDGAPKSKEEVPVIAIMGSGGGFRAMTAFSGAMKALEETKVIDCATYTAGLSGSSWFLSTLFSHPKWPSDSMQAVQEDLRSATKKTPFRFLLPWKLNNLMNEVNEKEKLGRSVSFTDYFGLMVGKTLLKNRMAVKLSDQQAILKKAVTPMPLYACVHVKKDTSAKVFHEWVEFTPYEIGMPKYGTSLKTENFGYMHYSGRRILDKFSESPLHYLQGIWGSAFCVLFDQLVNKKTTEVKPQTSKNAKCLTTNKAIEEQHEENDVHEFEKELTKGLANIHHSADKSATKNADKKLGKSGIKCKSVKQKSKARSARKGFWWNLVGNNLLKSKVLNDRTGRAATVNSFMQGLKVTVNPKSPVARETIPANADDQLFDGVKDLGPQIQQKQMFMVDAGLAFNSPYPVILRQERGVDLILSFDFSHRKDENYPLFTDIRLAQKWALLHHIPFPKIDVEECAERIPKEVYIFKDPHDPKAPIIMHFVLVNATFRKFKKPNVPRKTDEDIKFADFTLFKDPEYSYSSLNFTYEELQFDRLIKLTEYNVLNNLELIKNCIRECVQRRRSQIKKETSKQILS